ncbi:hypothetical protein V502_01103 [Pseudogymnoascus sp. VKM F-4520 (FW-2644)]|nr:hypothetical protein V502_01103 [Pseudogymnoascus sp. VKM F-4520 (FW-2644)]
MKLFKTFGAAAALLGLANAQNTPKKVTILTPLEGGSVGVMGSGYMFDVVAEFSPPPSVSSGVGVAATSTSASTSASTSSGSSSGSGGSEISYVRSKRATDPDDGFFAFINSPNLTTFASGPNAAAPGFVCMVNTSSDPTENLAGFFQLISITNSDAQGNILEAYFSWFVGAAAFGSNVNSTVTVFFLDGPAPAQYTGNPMTDPHVISNVATTHFFIFGDAASNATAAPSMDTPLSINVFTPRAGEDVGRDGAGWLVDMVIVNNDISANYFAPSKGYKTIYHDNFTDPNFAPGVSEAVPGLVVTSNTSTLPGGADTNLANLFQINAVTSVQNGVIIEFWCTWLVGTAFAGQGKPTGLTIFVVNETAPSSINGTMPSNIISEIVNVNFTLSGASGATSSNSAPASASSTGAANALTVGAGPFLLGALALLL